jgi:hypothetical protein
MHHEISNYKNMFEKGIVYAKILFVLLLVILSYVNSQTTFISNDPKLFLSNAIILGLSSALSFFVIAFNRNTKNVTNVLIITFLFFFFFQVCREMSGYYAFMGEEEATDKEKDELKRGLVPAGIILSLGGILFLILAYIIREKPPSNTKFSFVLELILFSVILSSAEIFIGSTHGDTDGESIKTGVSSFVLYIIIGIVFQYGGFYEHIFSKVT